MSVGHPWRSTALKHYVVRDPVHHLPRHLVTSDDCSTLCQYLIDGLERPSLKPTGVEFAVVVSGLWPGGFIGSVNS